MKARWGGCGSEQKPAGQVEFLVLHTPVRAKALGWHREGTGGEPCRAGTGGWRSYTDGGGLLTVDPHPQNVPESPPADHKPPVSLVL